MDEILTEHVILYQCTGFTIYPTEASLWVVMFSQIEHELYVTDWLMFFITGQLQLWYLSVVMRGWCADGRVLLAASKRPLWLCRSTSPLTHVLTSCLLNINTRQETLTRKFLHSFRRVGWIMNSDCEWTKKSCTLKIYSWILPEEKDRDRFSEDQNITIKQYLGSLTTINTQKKSEHVKTQK